MWFQSPSGDSRVATGHKTCGMVAGVMSSVSVPFRGFEGCNPGEVEALYWFPDARFQSPSGDSRVATEDGPVGRSRCCGPSFSPLPGIRGLQLSRVRGAGFISRPSGFSPLPGIRGLQLEMRMVLFVAADVAASFSPLPGIRGLQLMMEPDVELRMILFVFQSPSGDSRVATRSHLSKQQQSIV